MKNKNVPEIRFKGFSGEWELRKLRDIGKATGGTSIESEFIKNGKYKVISIGSYSEESTYTDQGLRTNATAKTSPQILNKDDLTMILNDKTSTGRIIGRVLLIDEDDTYIYNQRTQRIELYKEVFEPQFIYQLLNADSIRDKIVRSAQGNTQIYVNWSAICEFVYYMPVDKAEQVAIGKFFHNFDKLITAENEKLTLLKKHKKGLLQKMFPTDGETVPQIRFEGYTNAWKKRKLGEVINWHRGNGLPKSKLNQNKVGFPALHYADLYKFGAVEHSVINWTESDDGRVIPNNSVLFPMSDVTPKGLARTSTLNMSNVRAGGDVLIGQLADYILAEFMSYQINKNSSQILSLVTGTTVKHINSTALSTLNIMYTSIPEQTAIGNFLHNLDNIIKFQAQKPEQLKTLKKAYLQKMFV